MLRLGRLTWLIITLLLVTIVTFFSTSNKALITLYLWPLDGSLTAPVWLIVMCSFIIGGLLSTILLWTQWLSIRARLWRLQGKFNKLEGEVIKQKDAIRAPRNNSANNPHILNNVPDHNKEGEEAKTFKAGLLRTNHTLR